VVLELHYWEEMSSREIQDMLDINASTVRTYLVRGRRALEEGIRGLAASPELLDNTVANLDDWVAELRRLLHDSASDAESDEDSTDPDDEPGL
jgi:RNA polymerase sigma-70 factor (ECF subfamily)